MSFRRSGAETAETESVSEIWIMAAEQTLKDWYSDALQKIWPRSDSYPVFLS